jgi:hemerythrin superfamily protein
MSDAVQMLEEQHAEATALFMKLERLSDPATCAQIFRTLDSRLRDHTAIEEQIFYPAFRERAGSAEGPDEVREAVSEHDQVKALLTDIEQTSPTDYTFKTKISELRHRVAHHVEEEEHGMLPQARKLFSEAELDELGHRMMQLISIHSSVYQVGDNKVQTITRDTIQRIGDFVAKITG